MDTSNYIIFCDQLVDVISKFPNLTVKSLGEAKYLKGIIDVPNDEAEIVGSFLIEVHFTPKFPFLFPKVFEIGIIPNEADWHKYADGSCCLTVPADEILKCKNGIDLITFLEKHVIAFLANYIYRKETGNYKNGDYGHWGIGPFQFYTDLFETSDTNLWIEYYKNVFKNKPYQKDRNKPCFCGKNLNFKKCHKLVFDTLREIGEVQVLNDLKIIKECANYLSDLHQKEQL